MKKLFFTSTLFGLALWASAQNNPNVPSQVQSSSSGLGQQEKMIVPSPVVSDSVSSSSGSVNGQGTPAPSPKQNSAPVDKKTSVKQEVNSPVPK